MNYVYLWSSLSQTADADAVVWVTQRVRRCFCSNLRCFDAARLLNGERPVQLNGVCCFDTEAEPWKSVESWLPNNSAEWELVQTGLQVSLCPVVFPLAALQKRLQRLCGWQRNRPAVLCGHVSFLILLESRDQSGGVSLKTAWELCCDRQPLVSKQNSVSDWLLLYFMTHEFYSWS